MDRNINSNKNFIHFFGNKNKNYHLKKNVGDLVIFVCLLVEITEGGHNQIYYTCSNIAEIYLIYLLIYVGDDQCNTIFTFKTDDLHQFLLSIFGPTFF